MLHFAFIVISLWRFKKKNEPKFSMIFPVFKFKFACYLSINCQRSQNEKIKTTVAELTEYPERYACFPGNNKSLFSEL